MKRINLLLIFVLVVFSITNIYSQGVTTSSMTGNVVNENGEPIDIANVVAIHTPTGTQYGTITMKDGQFNIKNMRVGGPYNVVVSFMGFQDQTINDVYLQLNKTAEVDFVLSKSTLQLEEVIITHDADAFINPDKTGSRTNINREKLEALPSIARGQMDFTRLTPESDGNSFGGRNNLYNNFSLDGSIFNNSFGLDYATPGGQADAQPVSLDAIEQIQVSLAPFDVREGGFTGAGINAVTKSGTNEIKGTTYYFFRNENMLGEKVNNVTAENLDFSAQQFGASVGGPIIKDKLFFFINAEAERKNELAHGWIADDGTNTGQDNVTSVLESDLIAVQDYLRTYWGYEPGKYQGYTHETFNNKFLFKLDYNITKNHTFTIRYNMLDAYKDILPHPEAIIGRGPTSYRMPFENSSYRIFNEIHSVVGELNSILSDKMSNNLLIGYTAFRDKRDPHSEPFPVIDIFDTNGNLAISMGSEMFSTHNRLYQDVFQIRDNFTYYLDRHTLTAGFNYELFKFENSFNLFYYPWNTFGSVTDFLNNTTAGTDFNAQVTASQANDYLWSYVDVGQLALYVQDEFRVNSKLNITGGLRIDIPMYFNEIENTAAVQEASGFTGWVDENGDPIAVDPAKWPDSKILWSPRLGFNYDVKGDNTIQLRGGTGIFTGRIPFVWLGNQSSNAGINPGYTFQVNATSEDFKWPQVWKTNIAADMVFGEGWNATVEGIYGKDINAVVHRNYNMAPPTGELTGTGDTREIFQYPENNIYSDAVGFATFLEAGTIVLDNTDEGYQYSLTGKLGKKFDFGVNVDAAYTYMESKDYTSIPAEIAADAFQRNPVVGNPNDPQLSWSRYGLQHRFIASAMYKIEYGKMATSLAFFFEAGKGDRYSYVYAGDLNQDGIANNDLLYVPENQSDINFGTVDGTGVATVAANATAQWEALDAFIEQDDYLSQRRGEYAERNGAMLPWFSTFDIRLAQDFKLDIKGKENKFQLTLDLLNAGNLIVRSFGVRQFATTYTPITVNGIDSNGVPYYQFDTTLRDSYVDDVSIRSKWQLQIGIRYVFN
ncbi:MAG: carboxypeptidase regulatory-like domain-containing protein [Bacteroidales bacterium]|nr:carboxypeptidase regulatory-like domain-containing protein [Bacteroidales bacterium]